jgi:hypothetical protein
MNNHARIASALLLTLSCIGPRSEAATLELALVIDGSGSISAADWQLQIGAYKNVFQGDFYTTLVAPSRFTNVAVAAYVFSGGFAFNVDFGGGQVQTYPVSVFSYLDWTLIENDVDAFAFGAQFAGLPQPAGTTATTAALDVAAFGGTVSCPFSDRCFPVAPSAPPFQLTATGLLNNAFAGDVLVIDISTDGVPTEPNGDGTPNQPDSDLAIAKANEVRGAGITLNAIGVGGLDAAFLEALVGVDPAATPRGFFVTADTFAGFDAALRDKIGREIDAVPAPPAGILLLTGIATVLVRRLRVQRSGWQ